MRSTQDKLFPDRLRTLSRKSLLDAFQDSEGESSVEHPLGQCWTDATGRTWTPAGRIAWLWLTSPSSAPPTNFATAVELLKEANLAGNAWHESFEGMPDVLLLWLAHHRVPQPHQALATRLATLLHDPEAPLKMGAGVEGDGGWLDRAFQWLQSAVHQSPDRARALMTPVAETIYGRLLRCNLTALEDPYHVWGQSTRSTWTAPQAQEVFERMVGTMEKLGIDPIPTLNSYPLLAACDSKFLADPSPALRAHAHAWLPRVVEQAFLYADHPYRFPGTLVARMLQWPEVSFPECLVQVGQLPATLTHLEQTAPALAAQIQRRHLEAQVAPAPKTAHAPRL